MVYQVVYENSAIKFLKDKKELREKVYSSFYLLAQDIFQKEQAKSLDIKKMKSVKGLYRLRIGEYRALFSIKKEVVIINTIKIANRKDIYKTLS